MTLICRPPGRGNWAVVTIKITTTAPAQLFPTLRDHPLASGMLLDFGGLKLRVCEVRP